MFRYVILLALVPAIFATTGVKDCRSGLPQPASIDIDGCDAAPCSIALGSVAKMVVTFNAPRDIELLTPTVQAGVLGLWIDYALPEDVKDACSALDGAVCPLSEGEDVIYNFMFSVEDNYPKISVDVELNLSGDGDKFLCVQIPITVV